MGAPLPLLVASDDELRIAYISPGDGSSGDLIVTVTFNMAHAHMFGSPNDEATADLQSTVQRSARASTTPAIARTMGPWPRAAQPPSFASSAATASAASSGEARRSST